MKTNVFESRSSEETKTIAASLAQNISDSVRSREGALVIALQGELGAGKTTFVQGFADGLGIKKGILSPTFVLVKRFLVRRGEFRHFFHIDFYRLRGKDEVKNLGLKDIFTNRSNVVAVEWPNRILELLPKDTLWIEFEHGKGEEERKIKIKG